MGHRTGGVFYYLMFLIIFAGSAVFSDTATSGPQEDWSACRNLSGIDAVLGCTPIILHKFGDDKKLSRAFYLRGLNYLNLKDFRRAEIDFLDAISLDPNNTISYEQLIFIYNKLGRPSAAAQTKLKLREIREKSADR